MAKKLSDIEELIEKSELPFKAYLVRNLDPRVYQFIEHLSESFDIYIFSGVIRNYFLKVDEIRDLDILIDANLDIELNLRGLNFKKNSFGGYKLTVANTNIDLWYLKDTWALKKNKQVFEYDLVKYIPYTALFNFSSIVFDFRKRKFYYTEHFTKFLRDKQIDLVFELNPNIDMCIVNTFYYSDKFQLAIDKKLKKKIIQLHSLQKRDYETAQLKHFGKVLYTSKDLEKRIQSLVG